MKGWKEYKLAELYSISSGLSKSSDEFGFGYPFLSFSIVFNNYFLPDKFEQLVNSDRKEQRKCSVKRGDVFLTRTSETIEELGMSSVSLKDYPEATFNGFTKRLRPKLKNKLDPRFIGYYLRSKYFRAEVTAYSTLTTRASLNNGIINRLKVNLPNLETQQKIASILSAYDDLIENNNQRIQLLEEMAEEIYKEWFVRFRFPATAETPGYKEAVFVDKNGNNVPHGTAGALPEGWIETRINDVFKTSSGGTPSRKKESYYTNGTNNWLKTKELLGTFIFSTEETITDQAIKDSSAKLFPAYTVLIGMYGGVHGEGKKSTLGQVGILTEPSATNQACCAFLPKKGKYYSYAYLFSFLKLKKSEFLNMSMGAAQQNISQEIIKQSKYINPSNSLLQSYDQIVKPMFDEIEILMRKNQLLQETRDLLLPRLISGKLNVENMELETEHNLAMAAEPGETYKSVKHQIK